MIFAISANNAPPPMAKGPGAVTEVNVNRHNKPNPTTMPQKAPVLVDLFQNNAPQVGS